MTPETHDRLLAAAQHSLSTLAPAERAKAREALARLGELVGAMVQGREKVRKNKERKPR